MEDRAIAKSKAYNEGAKSKSDNASTGSKKRCDGEKEISSLCRKFVVPDGFVYPVYLIRAL